MGEAIKSPTIFTAVAALTLGLTAAETGRGAGWVRTAVDANRDGKPDSTAFGPCQMTITLVRDSEARRLVSPRIGDMVLRMYEVHVLPLGPGEAYQPTEEEILAYWAMVTARWAWYETRATGMGAGLYIGDLELYACWWRWGGWAHIKHGSVEALKEHMEKADPRYMRAFRAGLGMSTG